MALSLTRVLNSRSATLGLDTVNRTATDKALRQNFRHSRPAEYEACYPAAFQGTLPSMEAEIDCKLQSNFS